MSENNEQFNQLPEDYDGEQKRRTEFDSIDEKLAYDAGNLIQLARNLYGNEHVVTVRDALDLATRQDDDIEGLRRAIAVQVKDGVVKVKNDKPKTSVQDALSLSDEEIEELRELLILQLGNWRHFLRS